MGVKQSKRTLDISSSPQKGAPPVSKDGEVIAADANADGHDKSQQNGDVLPSQTDLESVDAKPHDISNHDDIPVIDGDVNESKKDESVAAEEDSKADVSLNNSKNEKKKDKKESGATPKEGEKDKKVRKKMSFRTFSFLKKEKKVSVAAAAAALPNSTQNGDVAHDSTVAETETEKVVTESDASEVPAKQDAEEGKKSDVAVTPEVAAEAAPTAEATEKKITTATSPSEPAAPKVEVSSSAPEQEIQEKQQEEESILPPPPPVVEEQQSQAAEPETERAQETTEQIPEQSAAEVDAEQVTLVVDSTDGAPVPATDQ